MTAPSITRHLWPFGHFYFLAPCNMTRGKYWCFTVNNPTEDIEFDEDTMDYLIYGREVGEEGTPHLQGYVAFKNRLRLTGVKKVIPRGHLEVAKGNAKANRDYCMKQGDYVEYGKPTGLAPGKRTDVETIRDVIKQGATMQDIVEQHAAVLSRYPKFINTCFTYVGQKRDTKTEVIIYWGASRSGKTYKAITENPDHYVKRGWQKWWNGYAGQECVIWDEFVPKNCDFDYWKGICDAYECQVEIKGGMTQFVSKKIIFTSNVDPKDWFRFRNQDEEDSFWLRIDKVVHFTERFNK